MLVPFFFFFCNSSTFQLCRKCSKLWCVFLCVCECQGEGFHRDALDHDRLNLTQLEHGQWKWWELYWEVADRIKIKREKFLRKKGFWKFRALSAWNLVGATLVLNMFVELNADFYAETADLPTCPLLPVQSDVLLSWSECQRSEVRRGEQARPLTLRQTGTKPMETLRKICGFHCDERLLFVSCLCGVAADGRVSSRWPLWCHTLRRAVCFERLVFPSLHFCFHSSVLALSSRRPLLMYELWSGGGDLLCVWWTGRHKMASEATANTQDTSSDSESNCDTTKK